MPFDDGVPYVLHNASSLSQPEVPRHLFLSPPNGLYAPITNDSPTSAMFKIRSGAKHMKVLSLKAFLYHVMVLI
jgi:hypothetical protein